MYNHKLFLATLSEFSANLLRAYDPGTMLADLTARLVDIFELAASGLALSHGEQLQLATVVPEHIAALEQVQLKSRAGPCVDAYSTGRVIAIPDLANRVDQWPEYCTKAQQVGVRAVAGIPMRLDGTCVGAVNLYASTPRAWADEHLSAAVVLADMATGYLVNASKLRQQEQLNGQLQHARDSKAIIEQAKGAIAATHQVSIDEAFDRIRSHARRNRETVRTVATAIVDGELQI
jgi:GAF domain-containing protein